MVKKQFELPRRQLLGAIGTIGAASAGAGLGTTAFFSDEETFKDNTLTAGELDMKVSWREHYSDWSEDEAEFAHMENGDLVIDDQQGFMDATLQEQFPDKRTRKQLDVGTADLCEVLADVPDDLARPVIELEDLKPGDSGEVTFDFALCDNPGYVWMTGEMLANEENGTTEPEEKDPDENGPATGELAEEIQTTIWYDEDCNNLKEEGTGKADIVLAIDVSGSMLFPQFGGLTDDPNGDTFGSVGDVIRLLDEDDDDASDNDADGIGDDDGTSSDGDNDGTTGLTAFDDDATKIDLVERAAKFFVESVFDVAGFDARVGVVFFGTARSDGDIRDDIAPDGSTRPGTRVASGLTTDETVLIDDTLDDLREEVAASASGKTGTDLRNGIRLAQEELANNGRSEADNFMIVLGDGGQQESAGDAGSLATTAKTAGTHLSTIAFGANANDPLLRSLASDPKDDNFFDVEANGPRLSNQIARAFDVIRRAIVGEVCVFRGTLAEALDALSHGSGVPLDGVLATPYDEIANGEPASGAAPDRDCFDANTRYCIGFEWELPVDHGNEVQTDSVAFDLGFYTEQCRHNDGSGMPVTQSEADEGEE